MSLSVCKDNTEARPINVFFVVEKALGYAGLVPVCSDTWIGFRRGSTGVEKQYLYAGCLRMLIASRVTRSLISR